MLRIRTLFAVICTGLVLARPGFAETCKYVDSQGRVTYSNVPVKDARKISCFEPVKPLSGGSPSQAEPQTPEPKADPSGQRKGEDDRRSALEAELVSEERALEDARRTLTEQEAIRMGDERNYARVLERLKPYQEAVAQHEKNVAAIKQELANLR